MSCNSGGGSEASCSISSGMETLNDQDAMRVLQSAAAFDATRSFGSRTSALGPGRLSVAPHLPQKRQSFSGDSLPSPPQALAEDIWREMAEAECGQQKRQGDLDSWLDVFRATARSLRNTWCSREVLTFESMAFGWLALARKHEPLPCGPPVAAGEDGDTDILATWLSEARWAQTAYQLEAPASLSGGAGAGGVAESAGCEDSSLEQRLVQLLGLRSAADLLACCPQPRGSRPAFFTAIHEESRTIRLVIRGGNSLPDLLNPATAETSALGPGFAHRGMLEAAQQLLEEEAGRLRAAVEAHPGYGLRCIGHSGGAGIAALLVVLVALEGQPGAQRLGAPVGGMRATCFSSPAVVTSDLAELHAGCIDSVVYNADLGSRCSCASLRRLANEMSMASREVLSRSELALTLRRSGALGLASHVVAAALCRCQPPQEGPSFPTGPAPSLVGMSSRHTLMEGLSYLGNSLTRPPPAMTAAGSHALGDLAATAPHPGLTTQTSLPGGRLCQLATLGPQVENGRSSGTMQERLQTVLKRSLSGGSSPRHSAPLLPGSSAPPIPSPLGPPMPMPPRPPMPPPAAPPLPAVHSNVTLPPLTAVPSLAAGGVGNVTASGRGVDFDSPRRRMPETHGFNSVLPPPPLVAAAAAAAASVQSQNIALVGAAVGPTPPRRVLSSVRVDLKIPRLNITATSALLTQSDDGSAVVTGGGSGSFPAAIPPLQLSTLSVPSGTVPLAGALPQPLSVLAVLGPRRDVIPATDGAAAAPAVQEPMSMAALPPLPLPVLIAGVAPQPHSPRVARHIDVCDLREQSELSPERSLRIIPQLPLSVPLQQLQQLQMPQGLQARADADRAGGDVAAELLIPGTVYLIERRGADANATFRLLCDVNRSHLNRILLKRSMLRDQLLSHYVAALDRIRPQ
ncbi:hypothetical protein VaNZ11_008373 [Volvox africanus]|uniref:Fungal lipase-type domain-containing protein n=1 Tax=Volvox africanus TaxID=51714 RepID=A0ABQ5S544_9CHLO|nr:hypothetical protein VaNZ11_008373 [Volvox africanus]